MKLKYLCLMACLILASCKGAEKSHLRTKLKNSGVEKSSFANYPTIKLNSFKRMRSYRQKDKYVLDKVSSYLQDQVIKSDNFSNSFYLKTLYDLPPDLAKSYGGFYLERELKIDGFSGYFKRSDGFMGATALQGYRKIGLEIQSDLLEKAMTRHLQSKGTGKKVNYSDLDMSWKKAQNQIQPQRARFFESHIKMWVRDK